MMRCIEVAARQRQLRLRRRCLCKHRRVEATPLPQIGERLQCRKRAPGIAASVLKPGEGNKALHEIDRIRSQRPASPIDCIDQQLLCGGKIISLAMQIAKAEVVGCAADHAPKTIRCWCQLLHLSVGCGCGVEPPLEHLKLTQQR
jgi:hypothetical protein